MRAGIAAQALRAHRWAFVGPASTQLVAAMVLSATLTLRLTVDGSPDLLDALTAFALIAVYLTILLVGVTMNAAIAQQARDVALLRAIGATPGRIRRAVALEAAVVALPAGGAGYLLGLLAGWAWLGSLVDHGLAPAGARFTPEPLLLAPILGVLVVTSTVGALIAAVRPSRARPAVALAEAETRRPRFTAVRAAFGLLLVAGGVTLSVSIADLAPDAADDAAFFVMLALCVGVGFLGPFVLRSAVAVGRPVLALAGGTGHLAADSVAVLSRALSGALVPLVLAVAFAGVKIAVHTTTTHVTGRAGPAAEAWLDYSGTTVYCLFAAVAAVNTLATVVVGRRRDLALLGLAGATRGRVLAVVVCEAGIVTVTGLVLATGVAGVTLMPMVHTALGTWMPYVPTTTLAAGVLVTAAVVAAGTVLPAALLTRRPPVREVR
ncbi:putative ABC transport system permease protein [Asanoa hainanensis]|uniref:Putative ABC transport system permease protein n=1 Tax=Asanoa hainanensis TaxID=560556 RepID=A0A239GIX4_9ACTN|nr:FtsX-like permease family protein [Asanoa hainanensis]SNS69117.1 putative ABC transport system permease protein [Asanoa hainanensis]